METRRAGLVGPRAEKCLGGGTQGSEPSFHCGPRDSKEQMAGLGAAGTGPEAADPRSPGARTMGLPPSLLLQRPHTLTQSLGTGTLPRHCLRC